MEMFIWIGILSFVTIGVVLVVLDLVTLVRNAGHH